MVTTYPLLGDLSDVPADYIRAMAETKRFLERWTMDPSFQESFAADPDAAIGELGLSLTPGQVIPLVDREEGERLLALEQAGEDLGCPDSVKQYAAFIAEKREHRALMRRSGVARDPALAKWRRRQVRRAQSELGGVRAEAIVHPPVAFELSEGCTVGCWFCGVAAPRFDSAWAYTEENAELWRECLGVFAEVIGPNANEGFLYWATDPLDNPDYESFLTDFHALLGKCPQTTTAQAWKNIDRTRELLQLSHSLGSTIDRFSIIALKHLYLLHEAFTPVEMLRVECVPQNKESSPEHLKSNAGRARKFAAKKADELVSDEYSSTIACVSGFLVNMPSRRVQLITPCNATDDWPLGYWVVDEGHFTDADSLRTLLRRIISRSVEVLLRRTARIRPRPDLAVSVEGDVLVLKGRDIRSTIAGATDMAAFAELLTAGDLTAQELATRAQQFGQPLAQTYALLTNLFDAGLLDEAPAPRPQPVQLSTRATVGAGSAAR